MRRVAAILTLVVLLAGCGSVSSTAVRPASSGSVSGTSAGTQPSSSSASSAATDPATSGSATRSASARAVAAVFAGAYVRFLDGELTAAQLSDATAPVRRLAAAGGQVPPARRRGTLVLVSLKPAQGVPGRWYLAARDLAHTFYAAVDVGVLARRPVVTGIETPDFEQVLAPPGPPAPPPPAGSQPALNAARVFLRGYLPWLYAEGPLGAIHDATSGLLAYLKVHPPIVPLTMQHLHPRVAAIAVQRDGGSWQALPNITDGDETYELVLSLDLTAGRWVVSAVSLPQ
jgi:uncharacterized protein YceK